MSWPDELARVAGGVFNLDAFDWDAFYDFIIRAHRDPAFRPSRDELRAALDELRPLSPGWGKSIVSVYVLGLALLNRYDGQGFDAQTALEEVERLLRDESD